MESTANPSTSFYFVVQTIVKSLLKNLDNKRKSKLRRNVANFDGGLVMFQILFQKSNLKMTV